MADQPEHKHAVHPTVAEDAIQPQETLIEFPCDFPIKVMGETSDDFSALVIGIIQPLAAGFTAANVDLRASSGGRFISLTCTVHAESRQQLDDIYRALTAHPRIKYVL